MELSAETQTALTLFAAVVAVLGLLFFAFILLRWINDLRKKQELTNGFIEAMRKEVGTDGGSTIASRLHLLDDAIKDIQKIAAAKAIADAAITQTAVLSAELLSGVVKDLRAMVEQMQRDLAQNQKYNELLMKAQTQVLVDNSTRQGGIDVAGNARLEAKKDIVAGDEVKLGK